MTLLGTNTRDIIEKELIDRRQLTPLSHMPEGLLDDLPADAIIDLLGYLRGDSQVDPGSDRADIIGRLVRPGARSRVLQRLAATRFSQDCTTEPQDTSIRKPRWRTGLKKARKPPRSRPRPTMARRSSSGLKGSPVVLYFYPKDDTPGCTKEACAFRDRQSEIKKLGAVVLGVSPDDVASHVKFRDKYELNFPLLADPEHSWPRRTGAQREKNMYGKKSMGVQRSTYSIDADGKVAKV
ncbi:MAG: redoxin domain-containing protein [Pirellulaceae bacterium]